MEREQLRIDIEREQLQKLVEYYGYTLSNVVINRCLLFSFQVDAAEIGIPSGNNKQIAELIRFLRSCEGSPLKISGTIQKPYKGQVKGTNLSFNLNDKYTLFYLELFLNTILEKNQEGFYQYKFGWDFKQPVRYYLEGGIIEEDSFFTELYTDEELSKIIEYEKEKESNQPKFTENAKLGKLCYYFYSVLEEQGVLRNHKTKAYSFIYDFLAIKGNLNNIGEGFSGTIGKEKYQVIKNLIKAYLTQSNKKE